MSPSDETPKTASEPPRLAFTHGSTEPNAARITGNVAAVMQFLATVLHDSEHPVVLDGVTADGLSHILAAAHNDLMEATEQRPSADRT